MAQLNLMRFYFADFNYVETCSDPVAYPESYLQQLNALTGRGIPIDILAFQVRLLKAISLILRLAYLSNTAFLHLQLVILRAL
jgi:hypothetical protein